MWIEVRLAVDLHPFERFVGLGVDERGVESLGGVFGNAAGRNEGPSLFAGAWLGARRLAE